MAYRFFHTIFWLLSLLPLRVHYVLSDIVYLVVYYLARYRRDVVRQNLDEAFPEKTKHERTQIERRFYHALCDYFAEDVKLLSISRKQMQRRMTFSGLEHVRSLYSENRHLVFAYLGHIGNWEWIASLQYWLSEVHCTQIYHKLYNDVSERMFLEVREGFGGECIDMKSAFRRLLQLSHQGTDTICGFISDQQPKWSAIHHFTPFLHHDTAVFIGTEHIAKRLDAAIVYARVTRPRRGYYHCEFIPITDCPKDYPDYELTDRYMQLLEEDIRQAPHLWLWSHKRWSRTKEEWLRRQQAEQ